MKNNLLLRALSAITLAAALCVGSRASEGTLLLDGRMLAEGGALNNATVTVYMDAVEAKKLTNGLEQFQLKLALGHSYTLVFAKPGCVTKELLFDTNTPLEVRKGSVFTFRFQVSLTAAPDAGEYRYNGPLAVIKFDSEEREFSYDRQHASPELVKAAPVRQRREVKAFVDPTAQLDAWVAEKRDEQ